MALGRVDPYNPGEDFCMTVLALKLSRRANAVSSLHGQVSRSMWTGLWTNRPEEEVPIGHITNGVHVPTWLAPQMRQVYDRHLGPDWPQRRGEPGLWEDDRNDRRRRALGNASGAQGPAARLRSPPCGAAGRAPRRTGRSVAQLRRALSLDALDDRLRAAVRHLQAGEPDFPGPRSHCRAGERSADADPVRLRRQSPSARRAGQASCCNTSPG